MRLAEPQEGQVRKIVSDIQVFPPVGEKEPKGIIRVIERTVQEEDGTERSQYIWQRQSFVVAVPVCNGEVLLKREFKYAAFGEYLTFAAGGIKDGETPSQAARREVMEEFGRRAVYTNIMSEELVNSPDKTTEKQYIIHVEVDGSAADHEAGEIVSVPLEQLHLLLINPQMKILVQRLALYEAINFFRIANPL